MDEELEIKTAEAKACEQFVNNIFEISKKYNLDFPAELEKLSIIVTASIIQNTRKEEEQND